MPNASSLKLNSSPMSVSVSLTTPLSSTSGISRLSMNVSATAPITTPQMLPSPPRIIIASMKIENPNWNWFALTLL